MSVRLRRAGCLTLAIVCGFSFAVQAQKPPLPDVLEATSGYLLQYARQLSTVAAEEEYTQRDLTGSNLVRRLHADVVLVGFDNGSVTAFRDVFAIDRTPVRQRDDRLLTLLQEPPTESVQAQAAAIADESVLHYINPSLRSLDTPTLALAYLQQQNQEHSEFTLESARMTGGAHVAIVRFTARETARVLPLPEGSTTTGRFWVDVATGTVRQTELTVNNKAFTFKATTKYAADPALGLWVPVEVVQQVDLRVEGTGALSNMGAAGGGGTGGRLSLEGRARYSKFRRAGSASY